MNSFGELDKLADKHAFRLSRTRRLPLRPFNTSYVSPPFPPVSKLGETWRKNGISEHFYKMFNPHLSLPKQLVFFWVRSGNCDYHGRLDFIFPQTFFCVCVDLDTRCRNNNYTYSYFSLSFPVSYQAIRRCQAYHSERCHIRSCRASTVEMVKCIMH